MLTKRNIREIFVITVGTAIIAAAVYFFMIPSHVTVGSGSALALVLSNFIPAPISAITLVMNLFLLLIGFLLIGPEFGGKTIYSTILMSGFLRVYEVLFPNFESLTADPFLDMIGYILVVGVGLALTFSCNASSGGLDIVAKLMNRYLRMELGKAMSVSGMLVALSSALVYDKKTVVLSVIGTYFGGLIVDHFIFGLNLKRRVCIISPKVDEITQFILNELHSGASLYDAIGAYDNVVRREINAIVDNQEYRRLMDYVRKTDPKAFITVYSVSEISYQPKKVQ
ncbi:MAG: YitT family protein [Clostridia bacterium]|nr:YitT family protein [Clostridia bacterium]MBQ8370028.1 YitT family protein [Clostridia bacterium]MBQ8512036.1 YitT family protein [Clostridia bacterium]